MDLTVVAVLPLGANPILLIRPRDDLKPRQQGGGARPDSAISDGARALDMKGCGSSYRLLRKHLAQGPWSCNIRLHPFNTSRKLLLQAAKCDTDFIRSSWRSKMSRKRAKPPSAAGALQVGAHATGGIWRPRVKYKPSRCPVCRRTALSACSPLILTLWRARSSLESVLSTQLCLQHAESSPGPPTLDSLL